MPPAQKHEISNRCLAPVGPVLYVMRVCETKSTAREAAAAVAGLERAAGVRWNGAGSSAKALDGPLFATLRYNSTRVATQPPSSFS